MKELYDEIEDGIIAYLSKIEDPRKKRGIRYRFADLLLMAIYAVLAGHSGGLDIEYYVELNFQYFHELIGIKDVPSHDTFSRVLQFVDIEELGKNIGRWIENNFPETCERINGYKVLHVDGKAIKAASKKSQGQPPVYHLNAMYEGETIGLSLKRVGEKENEISCLPEYLKIFNLQDTIVTIDAIGCNKAVIQTILDKKGHYLIPVKENQKRLYTVIDKQVKHLEETNKFQKLETTEQITKEHGRIEKIKMTIIKNTAFLYETLGTDSFYGSVACVGVMDKTTTRLERDEEKTTVSRSYVITDVERISVANMLKIKLSHWNVEAHHWLLDVQLNEDKMTARKGNATTSSAILRRFCLLMRKYTPEFESKPLKRFLMSNEHDIYKIEEILFLHTQSPVPSTCLS